jgi:hypothetical protein
MSCPNKHGVLYSFAAVIASNLESLVAVKVVLNKDSAVASDAPTYHIRIEHCNSTYALSQRHQTLKSERTDRPMIKGILEEQLNLNSKAPMPAYRPEPS